MRRVAALALREQPPVKAARVCSAAHEVTPSNEAETAEHEAAMAKYEADLAAYYAYEANVKAQATELVKENRAARRQYFTRLALHVISRGLVAIALAGIFLNHLL